MKYNLLNYIFGTLVVSELPWEKTKVVFNENFYNYKIYVLLVYVSTCIIIFGYLERERDRDRGERGERRRRSRSRDRDRHRHRHRSRSREGRKRSRSKSPKNKSRRRKPSLYWDVPPPGFEHIAPLQYKAMQGMYTHN